MSQMSELEQRVEILKANHAKKPQAPSAGRFARQAYYEDKENEVPHGEPSAPKRKAAEEAPSTPKRAKKDYESDDDVVVTYKDTSPSNEKKWAEFLKMWKAREQAKAEDYKASTAPRTLDLGEETGDSAFGGSASDMDEESAGAAEATADDATQKHSHGVLDTKFGETMMGILEAELSPSAKEKINSIATKMQYNAFVKAKPPTNDGFAVSEFAPSETESLGDAGPHTAD